MPKPMRETALRISQQFGFPNALAGWLAGALKALVARGAANGAG
jgi:hypothetical protein